MTELPDNTELPLSGTSSTESLGPPGPEPPDNMPEIPGYKILKELPRGGQARVYKANQTTTGRTVVLKVWRAGKDISKRQRDRMKNECLLLATLDHRYIVKVFDAGFFDNGQNYYIAMDYVHGKEINQYVIEKSLSLREKIELFSKVCQAVTHIHQRGITHRDLKSRNVLVDKLGDPHIMDFGLAKVAPSSTISGMWQGTLTTMSPEQAEARSDIDVRTDIYSLGIMIYYLLTGKYPYTVKGQTSQVLINIIKSPPIKLSQIIPKFDPDIEAIVLHCLEKDRDERYQAVTSLESDLKNWLDGLPVGVRQQSLWYVLSKIYKRHEFVAKVVLLLFTIIVGFTISLGYLSFSLLRSKAELQETVRLLSQEAEKYPAFAQQVAFTRMLDIWHGDRPEQARGIIRYFSRGTREREAAQFLLDPNSFAEKVTKFRQKLESSEPYFVRFIIAEHYLRDGNHDEAIKAYRECLSSTSDPVKDEWLRRRIRLKLSELTDEDWRDKTSNANKEK